MDATNIMSVLGAVQGVGQIQSLLTTVSKAKLLCKEKALLGIPIIERNELEFQFNPSTLKLTREPDWDDGAQLASGAYRSMKFGGNRSDKLSFSMLLDESECRGKLATAMALLPMSGLGQVMGFLLQNESNTLATMQQLYALTFPYVKVAATTTEKAARRPPLVVFQWGEFNFSGVVDSLEFEMLLFDADGNPRRTMVELSLKGRAFCNLDSADGLLKVMSGKELDELAQRTRQEGSLALLQQKLTGGGASTD